ncbi:hypothetical protein MPSEU_000847000 [Mayamaea pseudoterrestris]|nr:hypothetical protein MPSEU_000847000 [Mayamaea pseudoterrestris]
MTTTASFLIVAAILFRPVQTFVLDQKSSSLIILHAKPRRLEENVEGVLYVNDKCINCAACSLFAPESFRRLENSNAHFVYSQPKALDDIDAARAAMMACPVAAIRVETLAERRHGASNKTIVEQAWTMADQTLVHQLSRSNDKPFPRRFLNDSSLSVYWLGHHNEASFGAVPYLVKTYVQDSQKPVFVMIDTPKYSKRSVAAVEQITGPDGPNYLFLTHIDDTADHGKWAAHYQGNLKRIFHASDLGRHNFGDESLEHVEVLLQPANDADDLNDGLTAYSLNGTVLQDDWLSTNSRNDNKSCVILHTPGHSPGSMTLWDRHHGILFTGDSYAWTTRNNGHMTGFPRYGNDLQRQAATLRKLVAIPGWTMIAPGHGHARDYRGMKESARKEELEVALQELRR